MTHSMPDCVGARDPHAGRASIVHTGDFKIDQTPLDGEPFDLHRLRGARQPRACWRSSRDSTNIDRRGFTGSERDVDGRLRGDLHQRPTGKIVVAAFASSIYRMQILVDLAEQFDRKVAFVGRGMHRELADRAAARAPADAGRRADPRRRRARTIPRRTCCACAPGRRASRMAALSRIAIDDHRHVKLGRRRHGRVLGPRDPGQREGHRPRDEPHGPARRQRVHEGSKHVHVSGHGSEEELKLMLSLVRPRYFVPVHGEYRQLARHARMAAHGSPPSTEVLLAEDGDMLRFDEATAAGSPTRRRPGRVLIDGTRTGEVGDEVLRDRRHLAGRRPGRAGRGDQPPDGRARGHAGDRSRAGFVMDAGTRRLLARRAGMLADVDRAAQRRGADGSRADQENGSGSRCSDCSANASGRRPLVLPVVMEI